MVAESDCIVFHNSSLLDIPMTVIVKLTVDGKGPHATFIGTTHFYVKWLSYPCNYAYYVHVDMELSLLKCNSY